MSTYSKVQNAKRLSHSHTHTVRTVTQFQCDSVSFLLWQRLFRFICCEGHMEVRYYLDEFSVRQSLASLLPTSTEEVLRFYRTYIYIYIYIYKRYYCNSRVSLVFIIHSFLCLTAAE
jgi:hypothetical protein